MTNAYGPWATLIDPGRSPQLSAFWKRRLAMLAAASRTSPVLSRHSLLWLCAAAALMFVWPTFRSAPVTADEPKPANASQNSAPKGSSAAAEPDRDSSANAATATASGTAVHVSLCTAAIIPAGEDNESPEFDGSFGFGFYIPLMDHRSRKALNLSSEQEGKLREICARQKAEEQRHRPDLQKEAKELDKLPQQERLERLRDLTAQRLKAVRREVDGVLTPEQLASLKHITLCGNATMGWLLGGQWFEKVMSKEQFSTYAKDQGRLQMEIHEKYRQSLRENDDQLLAVLGPQQREQIEREAGKADAGQLAIFGNSRFEFDSAHRVGYISYREFYQPDVRKALGMSDEQLKKFTTILMEPQPSRELYELGQEPGGARWSAAPVDKSGKTTGTMTVTGRATVRAFASSGAGAQTAKIGNTVLTPQGWIQAKGPELQQKTEELEKQLREKIKAIFTPQQLATFQRLSLKMAIGRCLRNAAVLETLGVTEQQQSQLGRVHEERTYLWRELNRKLGQKLLDTLSSQQRKKLVEELDRQEWARL